MNGVPEQGSFELREPHSEDVQELARVHVQAWRETYGEHLLEKFFGEHALEFRRALWRRIMADASPESMTVLAERGGEVVGFAHAGPPVSPEQPPPADRELLVAAINPRAQAFYRRNGFDFDGAEKADDRVPTFLERRMMRTSTRASSTGRA